MAGLTKPLAVRPAEGTLPPDEVRRARPRREEPLWIAAHLPALALHAAAPAAYADRRPTVIVEPFGGRLRVVARNAAAAERGIEAGLELNAAFGFSGALRVIERLPADEQNWLTGLAATGRRFTPCVCLEPPDGVLIEVRASLKLFGGFDALKGAFGEALLARAPGSRLAAAPTPLAASWLARAGGDDVLAIAELPGRLGRLPLAVTRWPAAVLERLSGLGVATLGECLRLPRDGLSRRIGRDCVEALDKALGRRPDPRKPIEWPSAWRRRVEIEPESDRLDVLRHAVLRLADEMADALRQRQANVDALQLTFHHLGREPSVHRFALLGPTGDRQRLTERLDDELERIALPAPAMAVVLETDALVSAAPATAEMFKGDVRTQAAARERLVERLRARFGDAAVHGMAPVADHRPERAFTSTPWPAAPRQPEKAAQVADADRPLWLARTPAPLPRAGGVPQLDGAPLHLLEGPERIESGWWDSDDVARDYFVARSPGGERLWVYRERRSGEWYVHGFFG